MTNPPLALKALKTLTFSAASALVQVADMFCTVSDDQLSLEVFSDHPSADSVLVPIFEGELSEEPKLRKAAKPDLETLMQIPQSYFGRSQNSEVTLLALPSGSTPQRRRGASLEVAIPFQLKHIQPIDFTELYIRLEQDLPELNIEGAIWSETRLLLFQRGNGVQCANAVIELEPLVFFHELKNSSRITAASFRKITNVELPRVSGVVYSFTDAVVDPVRKNHIWFLAAAEDSLSTYDDGAVAGSILGCMNESYQVLETWPLQLSQKPEGLCILKSDPEKFYVVTDTDTPEIPSTLLQGSLPSRDSWNKS